MNHAAQRQGVSAARGPAPRTAKLAPPVPRTAPDARTPQAPGAPVSLDAPTAALPLIARVRAGGVGRPDPRALLTAALPLVVIGLLAFGVRAIGVQSGFELWVDEMVYGDLGRAVARGELPNLPDGPFFLHPPGMFLVEGAVIALFGLGDYDPASLVFDLRWMTIGFGAISVVLGFLLVQRTAGRPAAFIAAAVLTFEPFVLRNNSRVFLETLGTTAVLAGLLVLVHHLSAGGSRASRTLAPVTAGALLGFALLTKDVFAVYVLVPVVAAIWWRRTLAGREALLVIGATITPYASYLLFLAATGNLDGWVLAKLDGLSRMFGASQTTGFNAPNAPSLVGRLIAQVGQYGTSYLLLVLCPVAGVLVVLSKRPERRLIGLTALFMGLFGLYTAAFGTFEEQYGYGIMIASVTAVAIAAVELRERRPRLRRPIAVAAAVFLVCTIALGARAELTTDNGYQQFQAWAAESLPPDAKVGVTNATAEWMFEGDPQYGVWVNPRELRDAGAGYVLTQSLPTSQGYDYAAPVLLEWLEANATPVFRVDGPSNGATVLWALDGDALERGAAENAGTDPDHNGGHGGR